jgi:hypothetical protein
MYPLSSLFMLKIICYSLAEFTCGHRHMQLCCWSLAWIFQHRRTSEHEWDNLSQTSLDSIMTMNRSCISSRKCQTHGELHLNDDFKSRTVTKMTGPSQWLMNSFEKRRVGWHLTSIDSIAVELCRLQLMSNKKFSSVVLESIINRYSLLAPLVWHSQTCFPTTWCVRRSRLKIDFLGHIRRFVLWWCEADLSSEHKSTHCSIHQVFGHLKSKCRGEQRTSSQQNIRCKKSFSL